MDGIDPTLQAQLEAFAAKNDALIVQAPSEGEQPAVTPQVSTQAEPMVQQQPQQIPQQPQTPQDPTQVALQDVQAKNDALVTSDQIPKGTGEGKGTTHDFLSGIVATIQNAAAGGNQKIADAMGMGLYALIPQLPKFTDKGAVYTKTPEYFQQGVTNLFNSLGIAAGTNDTTANKIGQEVAKSLPELATLYASAPALAAKEGRTAASFLSRELGNFTQKHPALFLLQSIGSDAGAVIASQATGGESPLSTMSGAMAGGLGATGVAKIAGKIGAIAEGGVKAVGNVIRPPISPPIQEAMRPYGAEPEFARQYAQHAVEGAQLRMQKAIDDAVESIPTSGPPAVAQAATRKLLDRAERIANRIVSQFWERVPLKNPVPMQPIKEAVDQMRIDVAERPSSAPTDFMDRLYSLSLPVRDPGTGRMVKSLPTIEKLRDLRGEIRRARLVENASPAPNDGMIRNYNRLEGIIDDGIQRAYPSDITIDQARNASIKYHDMFSRGPIADVLARRSRGDAVVPPGQTTEALMGQYGGVQSLVNVRNKLAYQRQPGVNAFAVTPQERQDLQAMTTEAEQSIRDMFREVAADKGPQAASAFVGKIAKLIEPLAKVHGELQFAASKLNATLQEQKTLQSTALAKYASTDPKISVKRLWTSPNPSAEAKQVLLTLGKDPDALHGFQASLLDELMTRTAGDPIRMRGVLTDAKLQSLYQTVLGKHGMARLNRMVNVAHSLATGDENLLRHNLLPGATILARILGAQLGRQVAHVTGGGTVQTPAIISNSFRQITEKMLRVLNPNELLIQGIVDPKWEKILLSRMPTSTKEARQSIKDMRRLLGVIEGGRIAYQNSLGDNND